MKLTDLAIEGQNASESFQINRMHHGLNVIHHATDLDRNSFVQLVRQLLFGVENWRASGVPQTAVLGHADVARGPYRFRLKRPATNNYALHVQGLDNASQIYSGDDLFGKTDITVFDSLFDVDFEQVGKQLREAAGALTGRLGVGTDSNRWPNEAAYLVWKKDADSQRHRRDQAREEIRLLELDKSRIAAQLDALSTQENLQRQQLDRDLHEIESRLAELQSLLNGLRRDLDQVDSQIANMQSVLDCRSQDVEFIPVPVLPIDGLAVLYAQLDSIDDQIGRWQIVREDVQQQRLRLRDEMSIWNELSMDSPEHPYHVAREILRRIENEIDQTTLRKDFDALSLELGTQYKQLRHKSAAAELKQLREFFNETGFNITQLMNRRQQTLDDIGRVDPVGANAIQQAAPDYVLCAQQEGNLIARQRLLGNLPIVMGDHRAVTPDLSAERAQLSHLQTRRGELLELAAGRESKSQELNLRREAGLARRDRYFLPELVALRDRIKQIQSQIDGLTADVERLTRVVDENDHVPPYTSNPVLAQAGQFLSRLTDGNLLSVSLSPSTGALLVADQLGRSHEATTVDPFGQHATLLAVSLAANWWLNQQGVTVPTLLREVFPSNDISKASNVAALLREFGLAGHQVFAFTRDPQVADMISQRLVAGTYSLFRAPRTSIPTISKVMHPTPLVFPSAAIPTSEHPTKPAMAPYPALRAGESSWQRQNQVSYSPTANKPVVYPDRSDFKTFPIYRPPVAPPVVATKSQPGNSHLDSGIAGVIRPIVGSSPIPVSEATPLRSVDLVDFVHLSNLTNSGMNTVGDLLELDPGDLPPDLVTRGFTAAQIDRWQAQAWLMICVNGLTSSDARILVTCGITEPEQLETTQIDQLSARIQRYLGSPDGRRFAPAENRYRMERLQDWYRSLEDSRQRWRTGNGYSRRNQRQGWSQQVEPTTTVPTSSAATTQPNYFSRPRQIDSQPGQGYFATRTNHNAEVEPANLTENQPTPQSVRQLRSQPAEAETNGSNQKFHLNLSDGVEAAPSIGPRTAERFTKINVNSISDFLRMTADAMAEKIQYKRISADVIRQWQQQARLVCRVPNLRDHDAQLLVACGITEPEDLAAMQPKRVLDLVAPFSDTKEGLKIIRAGRKPDLKEVTDWINWAKNTRSLQAA